MQTAIKEDKYSKKADEDWVPEYADSLLFGHKLPKTVNSLANTDIVSMPKTSDQMR